MTRTQDIMQKKTNKHRRLEAIAEKMDILPFGGSKYALEAWGKASREYTKWLKRMKPESKRVSDIKLKIDLILTKQNW